MQLTLLVVTALFFGCSSRGVYEGIQQQEALKNPAATGQPPQRKPSYDEYEAERRKQSAPPSGY